MLKKVRGRFSSAHVLAAMALFVALGGSAYAVKKNSVGTKALKNNAVKQKKIASGAVTTPKIGADAVTGEKVAEATLGKVPSAATADSAATANTANTAASAEAAATAASADDSAELAGRGLTQVRSLAGADSSGVFQGLDSAVFEQVLDETISISSGGADLVVTATAELVNNGGGQAGGQCELRSDAVDISQTNTVTIPAGHSEVVSLVGFANDLPGTGVGDPEDVGVFCIGSIADDTVAFVNGDLVVQRVPVATGG